MQTQGHWLICLLLGAGGALLRAETVQFNLAIRDDAGRQTPARVLVLDQSGNSHLPPVAITVNIGPDTWFACDGRTRLDVPTGMYQIRVERGPEYQPAAERVNVAGATSRDFRLHRWIDMRVRGYRSGENHLHVAAGPLPALLRAEDLDFGTSLYWWNGPNLQKPEHAAESADTLTLFDAEVENDWGALYSIGLREPMPLPWNPARSNLPYAVAAQKLGALNCYQGGWSREALVDALLGYVDVINVGDNLFHRYKFMPRSRYSNLLGVPGLPIYPPTDEGMLRLATESYYRLLNCGIHLAAGAGSATGVKSNPPGYNRAYVKVGPQATVREFLENWRRGRNFITNGPMLFLTAGDGREPGDTIEFPPSGGEVRVRAQAMSDQPLRSLVIVVNGRIAASTERGELEATLPIKEGSWIAALATAGETSLAAAELARYAQQSRLRGEAPTRLHFAHTSPIYVTVGGRGARVEAAIEEAHHLLDAFEVFARQTAAPEYQPEILDAVAGARQRLLRR